MHEPKDIRVPAADGGLIGLASVQDIGIRVLVRPRHMDERLIIACSEFVNSVSEHRRFVYPDA
jgi:hypothetical protein